MFFEQSSKWKVVCLTKMHLISKNWEGIFDFQYKVAFGQCGPCTVELGDTYENLWSEMWF